MDLDVEDLGVADWEPGDLQREVLRLSAENIRLEAENVALRARAVPEKTDQYPEGPGLYFAWPDESIVRPVSVEIFEWDAMLCCELRSSTVSLDELFDDGWRFAGPIPEPKGGWDE